MQTPRLKNVSLGSMPIEVSRIGLGTVKFGRNAGLKYPHSFTLPTDIEIKDLLAFATELGINLLDTAPAYGSSEERLGKLLQKQRQRWVISTKVGEEFNEGISRFDFSAKAICLSVERSLKRLQTDYLDVVLIHSDGNDEHLIKELGVFTSLDALKRAGKIRAFGMSTKTVAGGLLAVTLADVVMLTFNLAYTAEQEVIALAHQQQKGVFIKKALASGHLQLLSQTNPIEKNIPFILSEAGVTSIIVGTINPFHLQQIVDSVI